MTERKLVTFIEAVESEKRLRLVNFSDFSDPSKKTVFRYLDDFLYDLGNHYTEISIRNQILNGLFEIED